MGTVLRSLIISQNLIKPKARVNFQKSAGTTHRQQYRTAFLLTIKNELVPFTFGTCNWLPKLPVINGMVDPFKDRSLEKTTIGEYNKYIYLKFGRFNPVVRSSGGLACSQPKLLLR